MIIEIVLSVCLIGEPSKCKDVNLSFVNDHYPTPFQCVHYGQYHASQWINEHPEYKITKFSCGKPQSTYKAKA